MYKHERTDILETHVKGALEEGLFSILENLSYLLAYPNSVI